jgi:hypothetical protein
MKAIRNNYRVNYPTVADGTVAFEFSTDLALGRFTFTFKWLNAQWNGWATLPGGEVRPFGCIPGVVDWTEFTDYGVVLDSFMPVLGLGDLVPSSSMYLLQWAVD